MTPREPDMLTTAQVAARLGVKKDTVDKWRQRDKIRAKVSLPPLSPPFLQVFKTTRYPRDRFEAWIVERMRAQQPEPGEGD